jgi:hypothetical protein
LGRGQVCGEHHRQDDQGAARLLQGEPILGVAALAGVVHELQEGMGIGAGGR